MQRRGNHENTNTKIHCPESYIIWDHTNTNLYNETKKVKETNTLTKVPDVSNPTPDHTPVLQRKQKPPRS